MNIVDINNLWIYNLYVNILYLGDIYMSKNIGKIFLTIIFALGLLLSINYSLNSDISYASNKHNESETFGHFNNRKITYNISTNNKKIYNAWKYGVNLFNKQQKTVKLIKSNSKNSNIFMTGNKKPDVENYWDLDINNISNKGVIKQSKLNINPIYLESMKNGFNKKIMTENALDAITSSTGLKTNSKHMNKNNHITKYTKNDLAKLYKNVKW